MKMNTKKKKQNSCKTKEKVRYMSNYECFDIYENEPNPNMVIYAKMCNYHNYTRGAAST